MNVLSRKSRPIVARANRRVAVPSVASAMTVRLGSRLASMLGPNVYPTSVPMMPSGTSRPATMSEPPSAAQRNGSTMFVLASLPANP